MNKYLQPWSLSSEEFPTDGPSFDQLEFLLGYAILAPSLYNSQPWRFRIDVTDVELFVDRRRILKVVDPDAREMILSCGAALYNLQVAAEYFGRHYEVESFPEPNNPDLVARFKLGLRGDTSSEDVLLFHAIAQRRTNRQPFENKPVPETLLASLEAAARERGAWFQVVREESVRQAVAELVAEADRRQWADKQFRTELARWIRPHPGEHGDGVAVATLGMKDWLSFAGPALVRNFNRGGGQAAADWDMALHAPVLAVIGTDADTPQAWLCAGQAMQQVLLTARTEEVWASFLDQPIQVSDLRGRLAETVGCSGFPQTLMRLGYGPEPAPTPRRVVRETLVMHKTTHN